MLTTDELADGDFHSVILAAPDSQGRLFGRRVPAATFLADPSAGIDVCVCALVWDTGQNLDVKSPLGGWNTGWPDVRMRPDLSTLRPYPGADGTAICMCDVRGESGEPVAAAPRSVLRRQLERAERLGFEVVAASELEFYLFRGSVREARLRRFQDLEPTTLVRSDYSIVGQAAQEPFLGEIRHAMEAAGIPIHAWQAEYGLGQWEMNLAHTGALEMADRHVIYKSAVKEMAARAGLSVTFMAKPVDGDMGSSCHLHCSLEEGGRNAFRAGEEGEELSEEGRHFLGGWRRHLDETALFFAPHVNSYKRHAGEDVAGGINVWGMDNRTVTFRVIGAGESGHLEHRYPGADANPYLAMAAMIAAGLDGLAEGLDPGPPFRGNAYEDRSLRRAPDTLGSAIAAFECSEFNKATFGAEVVEHYAGVARAEWASYSRTVTDWEVMDSFEIV